LQHPVVVLGCPQIDQHGSVDRTVVNRATRFGGTVEMRGPIDRALLCSSDGRRDDEV